MKIEIAELLIYSHLKHNEGCRIVQTNWKTSGNWIVTDYDKERAKLLFEKIKKAPSFSVIFKNNSFEQLIKQAEIDVLGINTTESSIYGIDVAFHAAGLNYGSTEETVDRIMKKIFRTIFIMQCYFKEYDKYYAYFVTPKASPAYKIKIDQLITEANNIINDDNIIIEFFANDEFYDKIVDPLTANIDDENDTSELFARAVKLLQLDSRKPVLTIEKQPRIKLSSKVTVSDKRTENGMKIGQYVQYTMHKAFEQNLISKEEINNLQNKDYSKRIFDQNWEVLRSFNRETKDEYGNSRYYQREQFCGNYHLTSQWHEYHWEPYKKWLHKINYKHA